MVVSGRITRSSCKLCNHADRDQLEQGLKDHHLKHHLKPLVQKSAAPIIAIEAGKEIQTLRSNIERINGELNLILDDADRHDPQYVRNITTLHKEVRESLNLMMKIQDRSMGDTQQNIQADTVNILKVELAKESPEVWARIRSKLMEE
jgi:hypothetical protein